MDNKKKILIGGGIAAAVLILLIVFLVLGGDENRDNKTTTGTQSMNQTTTKNTEENTTSNDTTTATEEETSSDIVQESSDEETTSAETEASSEETTTKATASADKETTSKKEEKTTKKNQTTAKQTTTAKQETTTKKQETTTEEQTTEDPKPKSGRIKDCELALVDLCKVYKPDFVNEASIYTYIEGEFNPFLFQKNEFGWENMAIYFSLSAKGDAEYYEGDDFVVKYPNNKRVQNIVRDMYFKQKYNQAIIDECDLWVAGKTKYVDADAFSEYLNSRYSEISETSIFSETKNDQWYKKWCYWDNQRQEYRTEYGAYIGFCVEKYEEKGYFTNAEEIYGRFNESSWFVNAQSIYCRWVYDANTEKTTIYVVAMFT